MKSQSTSLASVYSSAAIVSVGNFMSRLVGLLRDVVIASLLGAGPVADALIIAFRIPNLLRKLFADGSLSSAVTAHITSLREEEGSDRTASFIRTCFLWTLGISSVVLVLAESGSRFLTGILAPGLILSPDVFVHADALLRVTLPYLFFVGCLAFLSGVLHSRKRFIAPALAPLVLNCTLVGSAGAAWLFELPVAETLCVALVVGGVLQVAIQVVALRGKAFWKGRWRLFDSNAAKLGKNIVPTVLSSAVFQLSVLVVTMLASFLPKGSIAKLYFADRLVQFPLGLIGVAIGIAVLPALSSLAASNDKQKYSEVLSSAVQFTVFLSLPAAAGLFALAYPVLQIFFERGAFTAVDAASASAMLQAFSFGLPAFACTRPLLSGFYARQESRVPLLAGGGNLVVTAVLGSLFMQLWSGAGLAFAVSIGGWVNFMVLYSLMHKEGLCRIPLTSWNSVYALLSAVVGAICWWLLPYGSLSLFFIPVLAIGYVGGLYVCGSPDAHLLLKMACGSRCNH